MPFFQAPSNDPDRLTFLRRAFLTGRQDRAEGRPYLSQELLEEIAAFLPEFEAALQTLSQHRGNRSREIRERNEALARLQMYLRDFWEVLRRRARRLDQPAEVLTYYGLTLDGLTPKPSSPEVWLSLAAQVVEGDRQAAEAGYPPMVNPSAAEVAQVLEAARKEADDVAQADRAYDQAQETVARLRVQADELIQEVMAELRFALRRRDPASRRRIMRTYGARFYYLRGEPRDPDDPPEETAAPASSSLTEA